MKSNENMTLTTHHYWSEVRSSEVDPKGLPILDEIAEHLPSGVGMRFFEIGCAPGGILRDICKRLDYEANGIDYAQPAERIRKYLEDEKIIVGNIIHDNFLKWKSGDRYDVVGSFGFIEHFDDAEVIADRHFSMVKHDGYVVVEIPNFAKGQKILHWLFDRVNLRRHNTRIMNERFFQDIATRNGAELVIFKYSGGGYRFWRDEGDEISWFMRRALWRVDAFLSKRFAEVGCNPWFSPYMFAIYRNCANS